MSKSNRARGFGRGRGITANLDSTIAAATSPSCATTETHNIGKPISLNAESESDFVSQAINHPSGRNLAALKRVSKARGRARTIQNSNSVQQNDAPLMQNHRGQANTNIESHNHSPSTNSQASRLPSSPPESNNTHMDHPPPSSQSVVENKSHSWYSHDSRSPNSGHSSTNNPKNRILGRSKFSAPAMRSLNKAMDSAGTVHHKSNRPLGGERCFNFSYKEPDSISPTKPIELAIQHLGDGKHILEDGFDGQVDYISDFYPKSKADKLYHMLLGTLNFEAPSKKRGEEIIKQPRLSVWFGPKDLPYSYSYVTLQAHEFSSNSIMAHIKADVEKRFGVTFNSCLVNLYRDNKDGVGWHADDEKSLRNKPTIASLSFGETRRFEFCQKSDKLRRPVFGFHLVHGSGLLMKGDVQERWLHCVPREYHDRKPRLNLTFRTIYETM